ncbi:unnamed protein product [Orchesella dallaii]|uniref:Charged multivesicular body protein 6 n=1 Tax=Orchesella dallaii TaxID=48710 RepID=A0ABP1RQ84_9HEXA
MSTRPRSSGRRSSVAPSVRSAASQKKLEAAEAKKQIATLELETLGELKTKRHQLSLHRKAIQEIDHLLKEFKDVDLAELPVEKQGDYLRYLSDLEFQNALANGVVSEIDDINRTLELQKQLINDRVQASAEIIDELEADNRSNHADNDDDSLLSTQQRTNDWVASNSETHVEDNAETSSVDHVEPRSQEWIRKTCDDGVITESVLRPEATTT